MLPSARTESLRLRAVTAIPLMSGTQAQENLSVKPCNTVLSYASSRSVQTADYH